jgi:hypothetical protein
MNQIRNVTLIIIATAIMAIATSILVYFVDYLTLNVRGSAARFLLGWHQKYVHTNQYQIIDFNGPDEKNKNIK